MGHRHKVAGKWTTTDADAPLEVRVVTLEAQVKAILAAGGGGGTTPIPNPPQVPPPDITAPTVSGVSASVTTTTATVVATTSEAATVQVEYSTTGVWPGTLTAATSSGTSHSRTLTGLTPGQSYVYRVRATDTAGNLRLDGNRTFTTTAEATLPGAPTGLTATGGSTQVVLTWAAPASNGGSAITGYRVYRNGASLIVLGVVLTYTNTGLTNGLTYTYTVAAITAVGEGPQSGSAFATPAAAGDINPPIISNVAISNITTTGAQVSWSLSEGGTGQVEYGPTPGLGQTSTLEAGYLTGHIQTLSGLTPNTQYHLRVRSCDAAGNCAVSSVRTFTTLSVTPTPPPPASGDYPPDTTLSYIPVNGDARPAYLAEITDSTFGTLIRRITNVNGRANLYPKQMAWNKNGSIIFLGSAGFRFLDGATYADLGSHATGVEYPVWSNVNADYMYGCSDGQNTLKRFSVAANAWSVRHTFGSYGHLSLGNYEGNISANDTRIALIYNTASNQFGTWGVVIYDPVADAVISSLSIGTGGASEPNNCNISRSGTYVTVQHGADGGGTFQGTKLYTASNFALVRTIQGAGVARSHGDMLRDASGADIYAYFVTGNIKSHRLSDGTELTLLPTPNGIAVGSGGHVSGQAIDRDGWAYLSSSSVSTNPGNGELLAVKTDGSQTVERFGFHHAGASEPLAVPNRDGTLVMFRSPWGTADTYGFVARAA